MKRQYWGICSCGNWGDAPSEFDERIHFLKCTCGNAMYLDPHDPRKAAYPERNKVEVGIMKQTEKP